MVNHYCGELLSMGMRGWRDYYWHRIISIPSGWTKMVKHQCAALLGVSMRG